MYGRAKEEVESAYQHIMRSWNDVEIGGGSKVFQRDESPACGFVGPQHPLY